ncbi:glycoside hydrolase family 3 protein [Sphingomicrobium sediminis]|uniref:Glycoside hydrolase family 3 C-terminal domain-containing protein n=1 Tax=Sphingomicrobium sediminis TaxID=2950949 RepID=A0A9X2EGW3_9SPHN|nr:glycoside hydrolase family 3 N-terminal domain-containing protein [Sphingomicrobium sediminis]MCM8557803.1 glycoside hydrolase family 3 C-terminal domain-containing protein [Sphingomicrobium sediminis]
MRIAQSISALAMAVALAGCATMPADAPATVEAPSAEMSEDAIVADLISRMTLEQKIGQLIQPQINSFTPEDMEKYRFGSYLNGGNGGPFGDEFAPAEKWLEYADMMYEASTRPLPGDQPVIPTMWGTDAVHGHTNVIGATIFPHNIGLGATGDVDLVRLIGAATATEIEITGIDWNFSPTVAVARDDRWGRTYESYSEDPELVAKMGAALVEGLQGRPGDDDYLGYGRVIATAKHFFGDGGTEGGVDQGNVNGDIEELKAIHAVPYPATIDAGVQAVMASFNSINGKKMHGNEELLTGVLREELGFDGLVVGDWNGHQQVAGCTVTDCPQSLLAGLDIYMVPDDWKGLTETLIAQVEDGTIPMARVDDAVARVLRVKLRAGILGDNMLKPSDRANAGRFDKMGFAPHRMVARDAVAKSQVILKNDGILPLDGAANILVAGTAADSIAQASGGWTLTWQGGRELTNDYFPGATSIWAGLEAAAEAGGGSAVLSEDGSYNTKPDVAVVVFGEQPYAEFAGDLKTMVFADEEGLDLLKKFDTEGIPTVALFLSGRPMWMNREMNASDAFIASWLPGSEGAGIADIVYGSKPATGRLSFSWPASCNGNPLNGPEGALFPLGYGRSLDDHTPTPELDEQCFYLGEGAATDWFVNGRLDADVTASVGEGIELPNLRGEASGIVARGVDRNRQEDARQIDFGPGAAIRLASATDGDGDYRIAYQVGAAPADTVMLMVGEQAIDITADLAVAAGKGWREMVITEACAGELGDALTIRSEAPFTMQISAISRQNMPEDTACSF